MINKKSGNSEKVIGNRNIPAVLHKYYDVVDITYIDNGDTTDIKTACAGYDALAVCGGDGTLNSAINAVYMSPIDFIYIPSGTFNESAKTMQITKQFRRESRDIRRIDVGEINGTLFSYVAAAGTFTPIGYNTLQSKKKRLKLLAYASEIVKNYKINRIKADITVGNKCFNGEYTLIMAINSKRCFGFSFNKLFNHKSGTAHLLTIKAPEGDGLWAKIKIFFPFFRAFFIGFRKPKDGKIIKFIEFSEAVIRTEEAVVFTIDGERIELNGEIPLKIHRQKMKLYVF